MLERNCYSPPPSSFHLQGIMSRVYETILLLALLAAIAAGLAGLFSSFLSSKEQVLDSVIFISPSLLTMTPPPPPPQPPHYWLSYLPLLYSLASLLGVLLMALCTPLGLSCLFTVLGRLITRPKVGRGRRGEEEGRRGGGRVLVRFMIVLSILLSIKFYYQ